MRWILALTLVAACGGDDDGNPIDANNGAIDAPAGGIDAPAGGIDAPAGGIDAPAVDGTAGATCIDCATDNCADELAACQTDTDCWCVLNCINDGGAEGECKQTCNMDPQNAAWGPMVDCLDLACSSSC